MASAPACVNKTSYVFERPVGYYLFPINNTRLIIIDTYLRLTKYMNRASFYIITLCKCFKMQVIGILIRNILVAIFCKSSTCLPTLLVASQFLSSKVHVHIVWVYLSRYLKDEVTWCLHLSQVIVDFCKSFTWEHIFTIVTKYIIS